MQECKITFVGSKRWFLSLSALLIFVAYLLYAMQERVYNHAGQHTVYYRGLGRSFENNLYGYKITRVVTEINDHEVREGWYVAPDRCSFRYKCDGALIVEGLTRTIDDVVKLPDFTLLHGGYLYNAISYDDQGNISGVITKGSGVLLVRDSKGFPLRIIYESNECRQVDMFRDNKWECVWPP